MSLSLSDSGCHPGYIFDNNTQLCACSNDRQIVRCDSSNRYFYARVSNYVSHVTGLGDGTRENEYLSLKAFIYLFIYYIYIFFSFQDGLWVGEENATVYFANTVPGFLECRRVGTLPGCEFRFDDRNRQCATGRSGKFL